ncbi:hypothetical protein PV08_09383 [Exophiala spinifera]|uniref:Benzoate 4-monooxygenase cytochrome P450 n=1 Tax=Exophiala spinifera TaxID=91928 RepID=A0A0D2BLQ9_9EURO|nr:uncharacterized protein PV08_09383 [Exophiala spinifera]KIW12109.1 hypothetical protein PV08_09383 [Exophiala spinifera]
MLSSTTLLCVLGLVALAFYKVILEPLTLSPLSKISGPKLWALTSIRLSLEDWKGTRTVTIGKLHEKYGTVVRIGPREVSFNSTSAVRSIYGAGSGFERPPFYYGIFDVYGTANLFSFRGVRPHSERKRLLAQAFSKGAILKGHAAEMIERNVTNYLRLIESHGGHSVETFTTLHYFSLDTISHFIFGSDFGGTSCLTGNKEHQGLLDDIFDPARRRLIWCAMNFPKVTTWLYSRTKTTERLLAPFLPMKKPSTFTGVRVYAFNSWKRFHAASAESKLSPTTTRSIMGLLWKRHESVKGSDGLSDMDIASECADEFLAGVDTTSDSAMFLIWALSKPENKRFQERLAQEVLSIPPEALDHDGVPRVEVVDKLPFLDAVIKETLRMYAPIPASEPRTSPVDTVIDGYKIPAGTIVGVAPYYLHYRSDIFPDPRKFNPERWLLENDKVSDDQMAEMKRAYWPFASGARMCIGMHLALAEITTLVAAVYREYATTIPTQFLDATPGITSRFELFHDELQSRVLEHTSYIDFTKRR